MVAGRGRGLVLATAIANARYDAPVDMPFVVADLVVLPGVLVLIAGAAARDLSPTPSWAAHPMLVRLGEWSFALYLVHELMLLIGQEVAGDAALPSRVAVAVVAVAGSVALAAGLYHWFERPVERRLRGLRGMRERPEALTADG